MSKNDYVISLKKAYDDKPRKRRANYAVRIVYDFLRKHTRKEKDQIVISEEVNNHIWSRSIQRPPRKIHVSLRNKDDFIYVFLKDSKNAIDFGKEDLKTAKKSKKDKKQETVKETLVEAKEESVKETPVEAKEEPVKETPVETKKEAVKEAKEEPVKETKKETPVEAKEDPVKESVKEKPVEAKEKVEEKNTNEGKNEAK